MSQGDPFADSDRLLAGFDFARMAAAQDERHRQELAALLLGVIEIGDSLRDLERHSRELVARGHREVPHRSTEVLFRKLLQLLAQADVRPMSCVGGPLDLDRHQVVAVRVDAAIEDDTVVEETTCGYTWHDKTLRRAQVVVSRSTADERPPAHPPQGEPR